MGHELEINYRYMRTTPPSTYPNAIGGENNPEEGKCNNFKLRNNESRQENPTNKIGYIVLQFTVSNYDRAVEIFLDDKSFRSTNYLIKQDGSIDCFVNIEYASYALGRGELVGELNPFSFGKNNLNSWAITIQHINNSREHFSEAQIKATAYLMDQLVDACNIDPKYVLAHAYYAPERMISPGPYFPWAKLAKASEHYGTTHNFGVFSFKERQENPEIIVSSKKHEPAEVSMVQDELEQLGIKVLKEDKSNLGLWDEQTQRGILAFNLQNKGEEIIKNPDTLEAYNRLTQNSKDQEALDSLTVWDQNNEIIIKDSIEQYMLVGDVVADYDSAA